MWRGWGWMRPRRARARTTSPLFADLDIGRVCFATEGRDADTVEEFAADLAAHGGDPKQVHTTSSDMSAAFITGIRQHLPNATMTFDRYHLAAKLSEAVDAVRRAEVATRPELKNTRWLWLKNWSNLSTGQRRELSRLLRPSAQLATGRALRWREDFQAFYDQHPSHGPEYLRSWCSGAKRSRLQPIKDFVTLVERHWDARHRLARHPGLQRSAGRNQLPHPGGQGPCPRLPHQEQDDHYCVPHRWQAPPTHRHQRETCMILTLSVTHRIWRGTTDLRRRRMCLLQVCLGNWQ